MKDEEVKNLWFRPQMINVTKLTRLVDCDIMIEECLHAVESINKQLSDDAFNHDPDWKTDALRAQNDLIHKVKLIEMKKDDLASVLAHRRAPEERFAAKFVKAAQEMLPAPVFSELYQEANRASEA